MPANDSYRWNQKTLNVVFAASSVIMLLSVILMMKQDQTDEWREYQRTNFKLEATVREADLRAIESTGFVQQRDALERQVAESNVALEKARTEQADLFATQDAQQREVERLAIQLKFENSDTMKPGRTLTSQFAMLCPKQRLTSVMRNTNADRKSATALRVYLIQQQIC